MTGRSVLVRWTTSPLEEISFTMKSEYLYTQVKKAASLAVRTDDKVMRECRRGRRTKVARRGGR